MNYIFWGRYSPTYLPFCVYEADEITTSSTGLLVGCCELQQCVLGPFILIWKYFGSQCVDCQQSIATWPKRNTFCIVTPVVRSSVILTYLCTHFLVIVKRICRSYKCIQNFCTEKSFWFYVQIVISLKEIYFLPFWGKNRVSTSTHLFKIIIE